MHGVVEKRKEGPAFSSRVKSVALFGKPPTILSPVPGKRGGELFPKHVAERGLEGHGL